jgi:hypothetical protein
LLAEKRRLQAYWRRGRQSRGTDTIAGVKTTLYDELALPIASPSGTEVVMAAH